MYVIFDETFNQMRKFIAIILACFAVSVNAQNFEVSASGGGGVGFFWGRQFPLTQPSFGANVNINAAYNIDQTNIIRLDVGYDQKQDSTRNRDYLVISPLAQFVVNKKVQIYPMIGVFTGFNLRNRAGESVFDIGLVAGVGYRYIFPSGLFLLVEAKQYLGVFDAGQSMYSSKFNGNFGIGYRFKPRT